MPVPQDALVFKPEILGVAAALLEELDRGTTVAAGAFSGHVDDRDTLQIFELARRSGLQIFWIGHRRIVLQWNVCKSPRHTRPKRIRARAFDINDCLDQLGPLIRYQP